MPLFGLVRMWFWGVASVGLWVAVGYLLWAWAEGLPDPPPSVRSAAVDERPARRPFDERFAAWRPGWDAPTGLLAAGALLTALGVGGGRFAWWLVLPKRADDPRHERGGEFRRVVRPYGVELHVEISGRGDGPTVVLTHGWGATATEWADLRRRFGDRYRVVAWDLRGLGRSSGPRDRDFSLDRMADDLRAVLDEVGGGPAVLVGHSIGGMILLTLAKNHPGELGRRVGGLVLVNTTPTNPARTTALGPLVAAVQKPLLEPLAWVMIGLAPLVWAMNVLSYFNGTAHGSNFRDAFSWAATWGQVEFATRYALTLWPATYARGMLAMFRYHAADALGRVSVPTLVVTGDRDKITAPAAGEAIRDGVSRAELLTLSPCGHMGPVQQPGNIAAAVEDFLQRHHPAMSPAVSRSG